LQDMNRVEKENAKGARGSAENKLSPWKKIRKTWIIFHLKLGEVGIVEMEGGGKEHKEGKPSFREGHSGTISRVVCQSCGATYTEGTKEQTRNREEGGEGTIKRGRQLRQSGRPLRTQEQTFMEGRRTIGV